MKTFFPLIFVVVQLLLMEHKLPNGGDSADEHQALNLPEKSEYSKMPAELAAYYRDLSSTGTCSFLFIIISSFSLSLAFPFLSTTSQIPFSSTTT